MRINMMDTKKLLNQGFHFGFSYKLRSSPPKFYGCHYDLVNRYGISMSQITTDMFRLSSGPFHRVCNKSNTTDATCGAGNA